VERSWFIPLASIILLQSEGNYTRVHFDGASPFILRSLNALESRLPVSHFFRASRTQIINTRFIQHVEEYFAGTMLVTLPGHKVEVSRRRGTWFKKMTSL
jgi:two-component system LytT family response regulator